MSVAGCPCFFPPFKDSLAIGGALSANVDMLTKGPSAGGIGTGVALGATEACPLGSVAAGMGVVVDPRS
jgi:hypothetical protein